MKKGSEKSGETKPDVDKAKRVYRAALEAIRRLDEISKQKKAYREVFHQDAVGLRNKLKEYCERLMFYNPSDYGRKAEEVLWRKVFYEIIQLMKHNRKHIRMGSSLEAAFRTHLSSATGYYYHLLFRLQQEFGLKFNGILDFNLVPEQKTVMRKMGLSNSVKKRDFGPAVQAWAIMACHRCLVCLGDIARYQQDFDKGFSKSSAERFYYQAIALCPENGTPHNQLGTLSGSRYYNVEASYYYIRCLVCEKPFEGADGNLQRLFEKNNKRLVELQPNLSLPPEVQRVHDTKMFLIQFLQLIGAFHATGKEMKPADLQEKCQSTLQKFNLCMFYEVNTEDDKREENTYFLDDDIVFKIVIICMSTVYLLQLKGSGQTTAATAFLLALFSHILNHVVIRLQASLYDKENPNKILGHIVEQEDDDVSDDNLCNGLTSDPEPDQHINKNGENKVELSQQDTEDNKDLSEKKSRQSRPKSYKRRRRRARNDSSDSSDLSDMSDLSEGGDDLPEDFMSEESEEEEEFVGFFTNDSDSDMSDHLMDSQELEPGISNEGKILVKNKLQTIEERSNASDSSQNTDSKSPRPSSKTDASSKVNPWLKSVDRDNLAHFSSELFSSSMSFLGQNFKFSSLADSSFEKDIEEYETCKDVIQGRKQVSVPPGFASTSEAHHVAEITSKMANFVIETDTEASIMPTDAEQSATETEEQSSETESVERSEDEHRQLQYTLDIIQQEGLLPVVKVMSDWMRCNTGVISTCAQSSQSLWHRLSILLNILPKENLLVDNDNCWIDDLKEVLKVVQDCDWKQVIPLMEDVSLCQFSPLAEVHNNIEFSVKRRGQLNEVQETFLRIGCIRQFGYFLSELDTIQFTYEEAQGVFVGPSQTNHSSGNEKVVMQRVAVAESRRNQLMKDMAQLRLQAEVTQLEGSLDNSDQGHFPPYLIPDTTSLCDSLQLVKQLTLTNKGIVIIPLAVIDTLDYMKKESVRAREAIRWLETEFRKGNRYIRAQKSNEKLQENTPKNLKKKNQEMWCLYEIFSCARYLAGQGDIASGNMVAVMTKQDLKATSLPDIVKQLINKCTKEGIGIENISNFANKWKEVLKNKG
ncbi:nonsense-mediated mRNA decay factor SMG5-like isoform X1 [Mytilus galloprovincialis]|uniref:nonsense-mediated mRNA decay factor SMG5-like isoform X1 n=1 Tax=Mytilus galloprovincialis TaxID=29158 RepID=UPI003F7BA560